MSIYYIVISGNKIEVSQAIYKEYFKMERRFRYYEHDIKVGRLRCINGNKKYVPSKEDSLDRLFSLGLEPITSYKEIVDQVIDSMDIEELHFALEQLPETELQLLFELFWNRKSEHLLSKETGVPQKTINDRKHRILKKLRKNMKNSFDF